MNGTNMEASRTFRGAAIVENAMQGSGILGKSISSKNRTIHSKLQETELLM
jgi:hypothetical protein